MTKRKPINPVTPGVPMDEALDEWILRLRQENKSIATIKIYATAVRQLDAFLDARGLDRSVDEIDPSQVRAFLLDVLETRSASTAVTRWGGLLAFFKWATKERLCDFDPMEDIERPSRPKVVIPVISEDNLRAMFATCGTDFAGVRDVAMMRLLLTTGMRRAECAGIGLDDLDLKGQTVLVTGKGNKQRIVHVEDSTAIALRRYLRVRRSHRCSASPSLWVGKLGPLTGGGIQQIMQRRSEQAGITGANAHAWRHTFAHRWLSKGGTEGALMAEAGWQSRQMLSRYAASAASERARAEHGRLNIGEGL